MDDFSAGHAHDATIDQGVLLSVVDPFHLLRVDDNLGDEAAFPSTWQTLASDVPND